MNAARAIVSMTVNEFIRETTTYTETSVGEYKQLNPRIVCCDGITLSVQASHSHYCSPRVDHSPYYEEFEVGYPSVRPPNSWRKYFEGDWQDPGVIGYFIRLWRNRSSLEYAFKRWFKAKWEGETDATSDWYLKFLLTPRDNATNGVYGYVPVQLIEKFIDQHGGIDIEKTMEEIDGD